VVTLTNEQFLDSEDYWKDDFIVKFVKVNPDGSEWWQIINPTLKRIVSANSMLQAFKIAFIAEEYLEDKEVHTDCNSSAKWKAEHLSGMDDIMTVEDKRIERELHKMRGDRFYNGKWHEVRRK
jgi:hypothetical protein